MTNRIESGSSEEEPKTPEGMLAEELKKDQKN